jgi:chromosome transmission fidelity protein 8
MPEVKVHSLGSSTFGDNSPNPLPNLLQTPSGLAILEIQGTIHVPEPKDDEMKGDQERNDRATSVGKLVFPYYNADNPPDDTAWMKRVYLYVGKHQRLTGEVRKLPKALAILRKRYLGQGPSQEELEIVDIVKHKVVFSQRPEPVGQE